MVARLFGFAGAPVWISGQSIGAQCSVRSTELPTEEPPRRSGAVDEHDAVREQELDSGGAVVGKSADDLAIVVAIVREAVRLHHRPVGEILEDEVGRIFDAVFLLHAVAAPEGQVAATAAGMAADMRLCLDDDHRGAGLLGHDRGRQSGGSSRSPRCRRCDAIARPARPPAALRWS
jgi:hypothetical protein